MKIMSGCLTLDKYTDNSYVDVAEAVARSLALEAESRDIYQVLYGADGKQIPYKKEGHEIPISFMTLMVIGFNIFSIIGSIVFFTTDNWEGKFILTLPLGIAIAFSIIFDIVLSWEYFAEKYDVRFK